MPIGCFGETTKRQRDVSVGRCETARINNKMIYLYLGDSDVASAISSHFAAQIQCNFQILSLFSNNILKNICFIQLLCDLASDLW